MKYSHIVSYAASVLWAIERAKFDEMMAVLAFRASGQAFTAEEIRARLGGDDVEQPEASRRGAVAVIPVRGVIAHRMGSMTDSSGGTSCERIAKMIDMVAGDPNISTIAYDFDTPGGTVTGVQTLAAKMFALRGVKRQIAQINGAACSAGYWLAAQCDEIVSIPDGHAGSIGVFTAHTDLSKALEKEGIDVSLISAGKYKVEGNPYEPLSDEGRAFIQDRVDEAYAQFVKDVARGRGVADAAVREGYGEGRAVTAKEAKRVGLIDRVGTFEDTLQRAAGGRRSGMRAEGENLDVKAETPDANESIDADRARRLQLL